MPVISTTVTNPVTVTTADPLTITATGAVAAATAVTLNPGGSISSAGGIFGTNGPGISYSGALNNFAAYQSTYINLSSSSAVMANNGATAIQISGQFGLNILNAGVISGSYGLSAVVSMIDIKNTGTISGSSFGISLYSASSSAITNLGLITGTTAINVDADTSQASTITLANSGTINGTSTSFFGGNSGDIVTNTGTMIGRINLYGGNDTLDTSMGIVLGRIEGGAGDDRIIGSAYADAIYGDDFNGSATGADILYGGRGDDVIMGGKGNDFLYGNQDNDVLYGNQDNDWLHGGQGDDILYGGQGNDTLNGGVGDDVLSGNLGDDLFVFSGAGFGHDTITDFRSGGGADIIQLSTDIFSDFNAVQARAVAVSNGTLLTDAAGDTLLLVGISPGALTAAMFVFG